MYYDTLNSEERVSYLIKPILEALQAAGGQLERSEIKLLGGKDPVATLSLKDPKTKPSSDNDKKIEAFCKTLS